jgi:hypothetical protein
MQSFLRACSGSLGLAGALMLLANLVAREAAATSGCAPATVNANITANETWTLACSPYNVTANVTVQNGATVTIEPGVQVKFSSTRTLTISTITLTGGLVANGTVANPIVFTSSAASPAPGSWGGLIINRNVITGSSLTNAQIRYAGVAASLKLDRVPGAAFNTSSIEITQCSGEHR